MKFNTTEVRGGIRLPVWSPCCYACTVEWLAVRCFISTYQLIKQLSCLGVLYKAFENCNDEQEVCK